MMTLNIKWVNRIRISENARCLRFCHQTVTVIFFDRSSFDPKITQEDKYASIDFHVLQDDLKSCHF